MVEPSEEAGDSARTFRVLTILPAVVDADAVDAEDAPTVATAAAELTRSLSFLANASTVSAELLTTVVLDCACVAAGATDTVCKLKADPLGRLTVATLAEELLLLLMESRVGARFFTPRIGDPSASRFRMKLETSVLAATGTGMGNALTVAPPPVVVGAAPVVTLTDVCSGMTIC